MIKESNPFIQMIANQKEGNSTGIYSICSSNKFVIEAAIAQAKCVGTFVFIESTSNQVNQYGGYTGMNPTQFVSFVLNIARELDFPANRIILGGDHLGPNVWRNESSKTAMEKARKLIKEYILTGYSKIHIDTSMRCSDDPGGKYKQLDYEKIAERTADLCIVSERITSAKSNKIPPPLYVIGTEVPQPGGITDQKEGISVTTIDSVEETIGTIHKEFINRGLEAAWERVIAIVVQPGVEFGDSTVFDYDSEKAKDLSHYIEKQENLIYEAHSTDYQKKKSLKKMVQDHFAILKVGPWLTFALREAVFALEAIEKELLSRNVGLKLSEISKTIEKAMLENPKYWEKYYDIKNDYKHFALKFSYSDRCRYYWVHPEVKASLKHLIYNLSKLSIPMTLLSQYMPAQYNAVRSGEISNKPHELIHHKIIEIIEYYSFACRN